MGIKAAELEIVEVEGHGDIIIEVSKPIFRTFPIE
jgi:hypothetical protein